MPEELEIHLDNEGLQSLLAQLKLLEKGRTDHVHLMSESWGEVILTMSRKIRGHVYSTRENPASLSCLPPHIY